MHGPSAKHPPTRQDLLDAVAGIADVLAAQMPADEANGTLTPETVAALEDAGMFRLKLPACLGGAEADPSTQILVLEELAYANPAASWCTMVGASAVGLPGAFLPDDAVSQMFPNGHVPRGGAIAMPIAKAEPVDGGYRVTGRWPFGSGVRHSHWIAAAATVTGDEPQRRSMVFPTASATIHDNWQVMGLKGTGSCDFSVEDLFVPDTFTYRAARGAKHRGGPLYDIEHPGFVANEHAGFALGVARLALDTFVNRETAKKRGYTDKLSSLSARPAVQRMVGTGELRLRAARNLALEINDAAWDTVTNGDPLSPRQQGDMRAVATHCTDVAMEVVTEAFRYSGGGAIYDKNVLQQCLRDMNVAAQHLMVSEIAYENLGQIILGAPDADPLR